MDGDPATRKVLVDHDIGWPNGLAIDYQTERLWWVDAKLSKIESMNLDATDRKTVVGNTGDLGHPFSLAVFGESFFWTDWTQRMIYRTVKQDPYKKYPIGHIYDRSPTGKPLSPMDLKVVHPHQQFKGKQPRDFFRNKKLEGTQTLHISARNIHAYFYQVNK